MIINDDIKKDRKDESKILDNISDRMAGTVEVKYGSVKLYLKVCPDYESAIKVKNFYRDAFDMVKMKSTIMDDNTEVWLIFGFNNM